MKSELEKKKIKRIKVNLDKCTGCRACEVACSVFHARPKYSGSNPDRSRIQVVIDEFNDEFVPIRAAGYTKSECDGRQVYKINGKEYSECSFCGAVCPVRDLFKEPDSGLPLRCDMCEDDPAVELPLCVEVCRVDALVYEEYEEEVKAEQIKISEMETGLKALVEKYGLQKLVETIDRLNSK